MAIALTVAANEYVFAGDYTPASRATLQEAMARFRGWCEREEKLSTLEELTAGHVRRYIHWLKTSPTPRTGKPRADTTVFVQARYVKSFLLWCDAEGWVEAGRLLRNVQMPGKTAKVMSVLADDHLRRLLAAAQDHRPAYVARRNVALVSLLLDGGVRLNELIQLTLSDVVLSDRDSYYVVHGKGRKDREVGIGRLARLALVRYLHTARARYHPQPGEQRVFLGYGGKPLGRSGVQKLLERLEREAGVEHFQGVRVSPHTLRHSFAVRALRAGEDVTRVSRRLGHSRLETTGRYLSSFTSHEARVGGVSPLDLLG